MTRALSLAQKAALADPATQLATIWRITRADGVVLRLADWDVPLASDSQTWLPNGSTERSSVRLGTGLQPGNVDIKGLFSSEQITEADLLAGRYDYAALLVSIAFAAVDLPSIPLASGRFGEVQSDNGQYSVEINDLLQTLQTSIGEATSAACRATFGDARCQADLAIWRATYALAAVTDARTLVLTGPSLLPAGTYAQGLVEVMDGAAAGWQMEVKAWDAGTLTLGLYLPLAVLPAAGDTVRVTFGCDKAFATCKIVENTINFQGEPHVPGIDALASPEVA